MKPTDEQIHNAVFRAAEALTKNVALKSTTRLYDDLGMDSLDVIEFAMMIEEEIDVAFPEDFIGDNDTLGEIVTKLKGQFQRNEVKPE